MISTYAAIPLICAFSRAISTARASMSLASTVRRKALAAASANTPVPVPMSSTLDFLGRLPVASMLRLRFCCLAIRSNARRQPRVVPWWPVPNASPASICMRVRFDVTRPASCAPCTAKRPASTGPSASRPLRTQSVGASVPKTSVSAAALPAAAAISACTDLSSGRCRKCTSTDQRPSGSSNAAAAAPFGSEAFGDRIDDLASGSSIGEQPGDRGFGGVARTSRDGSEIRFHPRYYPSLVPGSFRQFTKRSTGHQELVDKPVHRLRTRLNACCHSAPPLPCTTFPATLRPRNLLL